MTSNKRIMNREPREFIAPTLDSYDCGDYPIEYQSEFCTGIGITINDESPTPPNRFNKDGFVDLSKYTAEYAFFKKRCSKCKRKLVELADPKTNSSGTPEKTVEKYKPFYDTTREGRYVSACTKRGIATIPPVEITCPDCIATNELMPDELILVEKDLLKCNENLPSGFNSSREYFLAFKRNYNFFFNLIPLNDLELISDVKKDYLSKFEKYSFKFSQVRLKSSDDNVSPTNRITITKLDDRELPPLLADINDVDCSVLHEAWVDQMPLQVFMKSILDYLFNSGLSTGTYSYSIDDKILLNVKINYIPNAFGDDYESYRMKSIVISPNANNYSYTKSSTGGAPEFEVTCPPEEDASEKVSVDSYRYDVEYIQLCE